MFNITASTKGWKTMSVQSDAVYRIKLTCICSLTQVLIRSNIADRRVMSLTQAEE